MLLFLLLYYGTQLWIGLSAPGKYYSPFIQQHLDYVAAFRRLLMNASKAVMQLLGYPASIVNVYDIKLANGRGVHIVYSCLGIGVMSFWAAFIIANAGSFKQKLLWVLGGLAAIFCINVTRVSLMLLAIAKKWTFFHRIDNHLFFNIAAYLLIFLMMYLYERQSKKWDRVPQE